MEYTLEIMVIVPFSMALVYYYFHERNGFPTYWPVVGMLPALLKNLQRINDFFVELTDNSQMTFLFKGPWLANMDLLATADPANVHHVMSKNFGNYPKGPKFNDIFDVLGDGIFNADSTLWQYHRKMAQSFIGHPNFHSFLVKKVGEKVECGLIPVLDHVSNQGLEIDLQDLFGRFTFDTICTIIMDYDPKSLSIGFPSIPPAKALDDIEEVILYRHALPPSVWKFQRFLGVGQEKKHKEAWQILDTFIYKCIALKREELSKTSSSIDMEVGADILTKYMQEKKADKFLRDTILNFFIAGRDTTSTALSWFFYLLSKSPKVVSKIREELNEMTKTDCLTKDYSREFLSNLVYMHAALCEALRLYPPVVFQAKSPVEPDTLPTGHEVNPNTQIIFNMYAMARMKAIWGDDCCEFKPERWISETGKIKHEPSYKFLAFNAGPRTCIGKDMAFTQMKVVVATILKKYHIEAVEGYPVVPDTSIILRMKSGFKVKVIHLFGSI